MAMTLADLLLLLPDNTTGDIGADDMRTVTTELYGHVPTGGSAGQVLTKDTATDLDVSWQTPGGAGGSPSGPAGGSLTGSYPDPTIAANAVGSTELNALSVTSAKIVGDAVNNTKLANMAVNTIKGRVTTGTGDPEDLTAAQAVTVISSGSGGGTTNFLRADGTWAAPAGGGGGGAASSVTFTPAAGVAATNVQAAIEEVAGDVTSLPTLTTSDTSKVPIATASGVTTINVANLAVINNQTFTGTTSIPTLVATTVTAVDLTVTGTFTYAGAFAPGSLTVNDNALTLQDNADTTKKAQLNVANVPTATTRVYTIPATNADDSLVTETAIQGMRNKTITGPLMQSGNTYGGVAVRHENDTYGVNDSAGFASRNNLVEVHGSATVQARLVFMHRGDLAANPPTATAATNTLGSFGGRGYTGAAYATGNSAAINFLADENFTTSARGARIDLNTTPIGTTAITQTLRLTSDATPGGIFRGALAVGAGSGMASAATGYGLEVKSGAIGYGTGAGGAQTQGTSRTTAVTLNNVCGAITLFSAAASATWTTFTVNNTSVAVTDTILLSVSGANSANKYVCFVSAIVAATSFDITFSSVAGTATDTPKINYTIHKGVAA